MADVAHGDRIQLKRCHYLYCIKSFLKKGMSFSRELPLQGPLRAGIYWYGNCCVGRHYIAISGSQPLFNTANTRWVRSSGCICRSRLSVTSPEDREANSCEISVFFCMQARFTDHSHALARCADRPPRSPSKRRRRSPRAVP